MYQRKIDLQEELHSLSRMQQREIFWPAVMATVLTEPVETVLTAPAAVHNPQEPGWLLA